MNKESNFGLALFHFKELIAKQYKKCYDNTIEVLRHRVILGAVGAVHLLFLIE